MTRLWNVESMVLILGGLGVTLAICATLEVGWFTLVIALAWVLASLPLALSLQQALVPFYLRLGRYDRALDIAVLARDSAPNRKLRDIAAIDVAMVHGASGRFEDALRNLEGVNAHAMGEGTRALVIGSRAWCRAHLGQKLDKALEEAKEARDLDEDEAILRYIEGLALFKTGQLEAARDAVRESLERERDPGLPLPGERIWILSQIERALGDETAATEHLEEARRQGRKGPFADAMS